MSPMVRFCPKCGKRGIKGDFCKECSEKEFNLDFKDIAMKKCIFCDRFMVEHKWLLFKTVNEGIARFAMSRIKNPDKIDIQITPKYDFLKDKPGAQQDIKLEIKAHREEFEIPAIIDFTICTYCSKMGTQYFEGDLQLRNTTPELINFVRDDIAKHASEGVHMTKETEKEGYADFRLTSARYMRALAKKIKQRFNGELTESARLFGRDRSTGKDIFRISVLFKMRQQKVGDIVEYRGRRVKIKTIGNNVSGIDVETGKKIFLNLVKKQQLKTVQEEIEQQNN